MAQIEQVLKQETVNSHKPLPGWPIYMQHVQMLSVHAIYDCEWDNACTDS